MTFDLFADDPVAAPAPKPKRAKAPPPALAPAPAPAAGLDYMMQPITGKLNRWLWRGVEIGCDMKLKGLIGHWFSVEKVGGKQLKSDKHVELLKAIAEAQSKEAAA